eukprot:581653-Amphidinium_carterae.1
MPPASIVDSEPYLDSYLSSIALPERGVTQLKAQGFKSLAALAYAVPPNADPATFSSFATLILGEGPGSGEVAILRRAVHESYALTLSHLKQRVEQGDEKKMIVLPPVERETRRKAQAERLKGVSVKGFNEPSHKVLERLNEFLEKDILEYDAWNFYNTRDSEVRGKKSADTFQIVPNSGLLKLHKGKDGSDITADVQDTYQARGALRRRSIAFDMHGLATFAVLEEANDYFFDRLYAPMPSGESNPTLAQLAEADRELWRLVIDECRASLKQRPDGALPIDVAVSRFVQDYRVSYYLNPTGKRARADGDGARGSSDPPAKRRAQEPPKGKGKSKSVPRMPAGLIGFRHIDVQGRLVCFNFNLGRCAVEGSHCDKGQHACAACGLP